VKSILADGNVGNRLIVIHAGSEDGFFLGAQLFKKQDQ
jgi:hypothetical protein